MTGGKDEQKKEEGKGFAGLSSFVTDLDTTPPPPIPKKEPAVAEPSAGRPTTQAAQQPKPQPRQPYQPPEQSSAGSSGGKWLLGIGLAVGALWLIGQINRPSSSLSAYTPAAQTPSNQTPGTPAPPPPPQVPSAPEEVIPPVGSDMVLSTAQIRYCLAEDIRMEGAKAALNNYSDYDVNRFNAMVADYNSRCGSFRYRSGALESASRDVEPDRAQLQAEGQDRFARGSTSSTSPVDPYAATRPMPNVTVQAIQSKLNGLGYSIGTPSGLMDSDTHSAILAFQRENGLVADGNPTDALLQVLTAGPQADRQDAQAPADVAAPPTYNTPARALSPQAVTNSTSDGIPQNARPNYLGNDWECNRGYFKYGSECRAVHVPQNGKLTYLGNDWECNRGYFKRGNECHGVQIPQNGKLTYLGNDWECSPGNFKYGNECHAVQIPENGKLTYLGNDWECTRGYFKSGNECLAVQVPQYGKLTYLGNDWECSRGYFKSGNECLAVPVPQHGKLTYLGNNWECEKGYRRAGEQCVAAY